MLTITVFSSIPRVLIAEYYIEFKGLAYEQYFCDLNFVGTLSPLKTAKDSSKNEIVDGNDTLRRRSRRYLEKGIAKSAQIKSLDDSSKLCSDSPLKSDQFAIDKDVEVYDLSSVLVSDTTFSEGESPRKPTPKRTLRHKIQLSKERNNSHVCVSDSSDEDIKAGRKMSLRNRTLSQTSNISATSTDSISSFTRAKCSVSSEEYSKDKSPKRLTASVVKSKTGDIAADKSSPANVGRSSRRRISIEEPSTPKKQKVRQVGPYYRLYTCMSIS